VKRTDVEPGSAVAIHTEKIKLSFVLFDEIEKASDTLWNLHAGVLDKATLTARRQSPR